MIDAITAVASAAAWITSTLTSVIVWAFTNPWLAAVAIAAGGLIYVLGHHLVTSIILWLITWPFRAAWRAIRNRPGRVRRAARRMSDPNATSKQRSAAAAIVSAAQRGST